MKNGYYKWFVLIGLFIFVNDVFSDGHSTKTKIEYTVSKVRSVDLRNFSVEVKGWDINITWETYSETNNSGFMIEFSKDGHNFSSIAFINGNGSTSNVNSYKYVDHQTKTGTYSYRLKQVDFDGTCNFSQLLTVAFIAPIQIQNFACFYKSHEIILNWQTLSENNCKGFEIERCTRIWLWEKIGFVENSEKIDTIKNYSYNDVYLSNFGNYYYRIKIIADDNTFVYSEQLEVSIENPLVYELLQNYPNPFNNSTTICYTVPTESNIKINVYNLLGQKVAILEQGIKSPGFNTAIFNAAELSSSIYFYRIESDPAQLTKKMILCK
ncbi:MAG: T9SS type A sorting domain-containing protein [bacterium]